MKLVVFGLTISSSWGNGHATLWRGLCRALARRGHEVVFFERDVPYYAGHRDLWSPDWMSLVLYPDWADVLPQARAQLADADVAIVTSYCYDALLAADLVQESDALRVFYDLDTPVTLDGLRAGERVPYVGLRGLRDYDLVLSYTGGDALAQLTSLLGARRVAPLYGHVDPAVHAPRSVESQYSADLSYLGTYAVDRQAALEAYFVEAARRLPHLKFVIGGAQYPEEFPWVPNLYFVRHLPPAEHPAFFSSSRLTLNVTRSSMARMGYCPSGRLFEAAACGAPIITDAWDGLDQFFAPDSEILVVRSTDDAVAALHLSPQELRAVALRARERVLDMHTSDHRARELEGILNDAASDAPAVGDLAATAAVAAGAGDASERLLEA